MFVLMSNIFLLIILKKTKNTKILNFLIKNKNFFKIIFFKKKVNKIQFYSNLKFLVKKKKIFFLK